MLTLELSVLVLEIPNDAYTTLSRNLIGCSTLRQEYLQADWLIVQNNEKATLNINMPYCGKPAPDSLKIQNTLCRYLIYLLHSSDRCMKIRSYLPRCLSNKVDPCPLLCLCSNPNKSSHAVSKERSQ